jgi:GDPmannose 4,6-dehydratase
MVLKKMDKNKTAIVTGVTGQDGSYLTELLLSKGYTVFGLKRRSSSFNTSRIDHIISNPKYKEKFFYAYFDLTDSLSILNLVSKIQPDEIYNLAAMSQVRVSFDMPEYTANADGIGTLRILEAIRSLKLINKTKFYQASTSELYGLIQEVPQSETTPFYPRSPYGVAKLYSYWIVKNYREAYGVFASNGILFNHESYRRGETFVTRKITRGISQIIHGKRELIELGNLNASRDWGHASDYVHAMYLMLQSDIPNDFVISTGKETTVRDFISKSMKLVGCEIEFNGEGLEEVGVISSISRSPLLDEYNIISKLEIGQTIIKINPHFFRPTEVERLVGDSTKALNEIGWKAKTTIDEMIDEMIRYDIVEESKNKVLLDKGFTTFNSIEDVL